MKARLPARRDPRIQIIKLVHAGFFAPGINTLGHGWFRMFLGDKLVRELPIHADDWRRADSSEGDGSVSWTIEPVPETEGPLEYDYLDIVLAGEDEPSRSLNGGQPVKIWESFDHMNVGPYEPGNVEKWRWRANWISPILRLA